MGGQGITYERGKAGGVYDSGRRRDRLKRLCRRAISVKKLIRPLEKPTLLGGRFALGRGEVRKKHPKQQDDTSLHWDAVSQTTKKQKKHNQKRILE